MQSIKQRVSEIGGKNRASRNPRTGLQEFAVECADEGGCRQDYVVADPIQTVNHTFVYDASGNYNPNQSHVSFVDPSGYGGPMGNQPDPSGLAPGGSADQPGFLGQVIPPDEDTETGTVPMPPVDGQVVDLSDGLEAVERNLESTPDNVLLWALQEAQQEWKNFNFGSGLPLLGPVLGGNTIYMKEHQNLYGRIIDFQYEIQRRIDNGTWTLNNTAST